MNDTVDQLIDCAQMAGVAPETLLAGAEQIRAVARRRLSNCDLKTAIVKINNEMENTASAEFSLTTPLTSEIGPRPVVTLTLDGEDEDIKSCLQAIARAVSDKQPTQPMLDLLRGTKGQPVHILCILAGEKASASPSQDTREHPLYH